MPKLYDKFPIPVEDITGYLIYGAKGTTPDKEGSINLKEQLFKLPTLIDATVGIGGDYASVKDAVDDNKWRLKIISDITMSEELPLTSASRLLLYGNGQTITLQGVNSVLSNSNLNPYIYVDGLIFEMPNAETIDKAYFNYAYMHINNCEIIGSENELVRFAWSIKEINNSKIDMKTNTLQIQMPAGGNISNLEIYGNSSACYGFRINNAKADNISWHGTFHSVYGFLYYSQGIFNNFDFSDATGGCIISPNTVFNSPKKLKLVNSSKVVINNAITVNVGGIDYGVINFNSHDCIFNNCEFTTFAYGQLYGQDNVYNNCKFTDNLRYSIFDNTVLNNCEFNGNLITYRNVNYANNMQINNCKFNAGYLTICGNNCTVKDTHMIDGSIRIYDTADKTNISGNRTLSAIVDSGTNTYNLIDNYLI